MNEMGGGKQERFPSKKSCFIQSHGQIHDLIQQSNMRDKWEGREATHDEHMNERGKQERVPSQKKLLYIKKEDK